MQLSHYSIKHRSIYFGHTRTIMRFVRCDFVHLFAANLKTIITLLSYTYTPMILNDNFIFLGYHSI